MWAARPTGGRAPCWTMSGRPRFLHFASMPWPCSPPSSRWEGASFTPSTAHLGLPPDLLSDATRNGNSVLRLLRYPSADFTGPSLRAGPHEDINAITLLLGAEEAGLEILTRDGDWLAINPSPGAVVVNIGDMLARLTNDLLPSTTHRVVNPTPERRGVARYSMPFFLHFRSDFLIETLPQCVSAERPNRYPIPITAGDFLDLRLREIRLVVKFSAGRIRPGRPGAPSPAGRRCGRSAGAHRVRDPRRSTSGDWAARRPDARPGRE